MQTFYVPKNTGNTDAAYLADQANYYRYQIFTDGVIVRSDYGPRITEASTTGIAVPALTP